MSMAQPLVSIIVPVYNGEKTIERCLRSIQNQSYSNIEVLVVNDGSSDHTERIIRKYVQRDSRFRYIEKENTGVSDSRNVAMAEAKGDYFQFVDGDDWIEPDMFEKLYESRQRRNLSIQHLPMGAIW